jgi:hypothetical protein
MEINRLDNAIGAVALAAIKEGLMVVMTTDGSGNVAAKVPADATEAKDARFVAVWKQLNTPFPGPLAYPSIEWSMRPGGFDVAQNNSPMTQEVWLTPPNIQVGTTIPSGYDLVMQQGVHTVESGMFVANVGLVPGAKLEALNSGDDGANAGKLNLTSTDADTVAYVVKYDTTSQRLTFMTRAL